MEHHNDIVMELRGWNSPLADMSRKMPYALPEGYFQSLPGNMIQDILLSNMPDPVPAFSKQMPYTVPDGYFDALPEQLLLIANPRTSFSTGDMPFEVPQGYFNTLPQQLLAVAKAADKQETPAVQQPVKSKTISLGSTIWKNVRWAAAAILLLGIGTASYNSFMAQPSATAERQLAALPNGVIDAYVQQNIDEFDADMIANNLASPGSTLNAPSALSDQDITQYLEDAGWE